MECSINSFIINQIEQSSHTNQAELTLVVVTTALGGVFAAAVMKQLDSIAKIFCSALASVAIGFTTSALFPEQFVIGIPVVFGTMIIMASTGVYAKDSMDAVICC